MAEFAADGEPPPGDIALDSGDAGAVAIGVLELGGAGLDEQAGAVADDGVESGFLDHLVAHDVARGETGVAVLPPGADIARKLVADIGDVEPAFHGDGVAFGHLPGWAVIHRAEAQAAVE